MTREEAIKILENEKKCVKRAEYCDRQCGKCELVKEDKIILKTFDMAIEALEQEPKSEWQKDHEILKAYSDGANGVLDKIKAEIDRQEKWLMSAGCNAYNVDIAFNSIKSVLSESEE